jgi:polysaccharide export outer membrane protein
MRNQNVVTIGRVEPEAGRSARVLALLFAAAVLLMISLAGCVGSRGGPIPYDVKNFGQPDSPTVVAASTDYKIAPMDTLRITVFQVPDLSGEFDVDLTGNVSLPLIGEVKAADLTTVELDKVITARLSDKYLQNPEVNVGLKQSARRNVTLDGSVNQPGMYAVNGPTTLIQAVALARGTSSDANPHRVAIFRQVQGKRMAAAFDLVSIRKGEMEDPPVYSGDIIVVDGSRIKAIQNQILMSLPVIGAFNPVLF